MGLVIPAQAVRDLISEGDYIVECIEQREHGRAMVTLALRSRAQPYTLQIETGESKLEGLFRALMNGKDPGKKGKRVVMAGSQPVPVVEVEAIPADQPRRRRRRVKEAAQVNTSHTSESSTPEEPLTRAKRRRSAIQQLILVPQESSQRSAQRPGRTKPRAGSQPSSKSKNR